MLAEMQKVTQEATLPKSVAQKYLTIYVGDADWKDHIDTLYFRFVKKYGDAASEKMRQAIAFAILLPLHDRSTRIDIEHPENLMFRGPSFHQFDSKDWFAELQKVMKRDIKIQEDWRIQCLKLGYIDPIENQTFCRQAFNWIYERAQEAGDLTPLNKEDLTRRFRNLVWAYGGAVLSNLFTNHQNVTNKILNWRTGYFVEQAVFDAYSLDQVLKIKTAELERTPQKMRREFIQ